MSGTRTQANTDLTPFHACIFRSRWYDKYVLWNFMQAKSEEEISQHMVKKSTRRPLAEAVKYDSRTDISLCEEVMDSQGTAWR